MMRMDFGAVAIRAALVGAIAIGCGSCSEEYLARRDTMSPGSGNALQADIATQVINPWPPSANRIYAPTDGALLQHAIETYRNPASGPAPPASSGAVGTPTH